MSAKTEIIQAALSLPNGIAEYLDVTLDGFSQMDEPSTVDDAVIASGVLAARLNNALVPFNGMKPVQIAMRIAQHHPAIIGLLVSALEYVGGGKLTIMKPEANGMYPGWFDSWIVQCTDEFVDAILVEMDGDEADTFALNKEGETWTATWPIALGEHSARVIATRLDASTIEAEVTFAVVAWTTYPAQGASYTPDQLSTISASTPAGGSEVEKVSVLWFGEAIELQLSTYGTWETQGINTSTLLEGAHNMVLSVTYATGAIAQSMIEFVITGEVG